MKKMHTSTAFCFTIILLAVINLEIAAADPPSNNISSLKKSIHLDHWQIVKDTQPNNSLSFIPDSLWRAFKPTLDDNRYTEGNWLIRTSIVIQDSLNDKEVLGLFPINFLTAYEIYWDSIMIAENGEIGTNKTEEKA
ncbi:MAG: hypothetical protein MUE93_06995, partial [Ignavibacteriaceae bacterium]|nr:hypothetical protein [Ignavibacteriaceae bacterium]